MNYLPFTRPTLDEETIQAVADTLRSGWITTGPRVTEFEQALSDYLGGMRAVRTFTSATGGLEVALQCCRVQPGDQVILPAMSFAATANVIVRVGATPVFVDVDLKTRNIDLSQAAAAVTEKTKAIMPVHFAGLAVEMDRLYRLANERGLRIIEDAAHAIGTAWQGRKIGSFGDIVSFSFHPNKNMTTIEGGALVISEPDEVKLAELLRFHGIVKDRDGNVDVELAGGKYNLSDVSAAIGLMQLKRLDEFNAKRRTLVVRYFERLAGHELLCLPARGDEGHSWHMFAPLIAFGRLKLTRAEFIRAMHQRGIGLGIHYPAMHTFSLYRRLGYQEGMFPNAERIGRETVTLPLFPAMETADVDRVCDALLDIISESKC